MSIYEEVGAQLKESMRARDRERTTALRNIRAAFIEHMKRDASEQVSDADAEDLLRRLAKQRRESIKAYEDGGREELAAEERSELQVIESFLPTLATAAETRVWVEAAIRTAGASSPKEIGKVMGALMQAHRGQVDGDLARRIAQELLGGA